MEEQKHTPEPWFVTGSERIKYVEARVGNGMLQEVAACMIVEHGNHEAYARRIVACVNACQGYPTDVLEQHPTPIITMLLNQRDAAEKQRDMILAAAKNLRDVKGRHNTEIAMTRLYSAIANVEAAK